MKRKRNPMITPIGSLEKDDFVYSLEEWEKNNPDKKLDFGAVYRDFWERKIDCSLVGIEKYILET